MGWFRKRRGGKEDVPQSVVHYRAFNKDEYDLYPWSGKNVAFLTPTNDLDPKIVKRILNKLDKAWDFYASSTGRQPISHPPFTYNGRTTIAVVKKTCGAGCAYVGWKGVELMESTFDSLYENVKENNEYVQVPFYEFGRNFYFYRNKITYLKDAEGGSITTGYAVFMRFLAMEAVRVKGADFGGVSFKEFKREVKDLVSKYEKNSAWNWENTLAIGKAPTNKMDLGGADLFASFLFALKRRYGSRFIDKLWKIVSVQPNIMTTQDAIDNFVASCSFASNKNLVSLFESKWKWPVSDVVKKRIEGGLTSRLPIVPKNSQNSAEDSKKKIFI